MQRGVAVRMPGQPRLAGEQQPAQVQLATLLQPMRVESDPGGLPVP